MPPIPPEQSNDAEEVVWALQTARRLWETGDLEMAATWLKRAAQSAGEAGDDERALALARAAADIQEPMPPPPPPPPHEEIEEIEPLEELEPIEEQGPDLTLSPPSHPLPKTRPPAPPRILAAPPPPPLPPPTSPVPPPPHEEEIVTSAPPLSALSPAEEAERARLDSLDEETLDGDKLSLGLAALEKRILTSDDGPAVVPSASAQPPVPPPPLPAEETDPYPFEKPPVPASGAAPLPVRTDVAPSPFEEPAHPSVSPFEEPAHPSLSPFQDAPLPAEEEATDSPSTPAAAAPLHLELDALDAPAQPIPQSSPPLEPITPPPAATFEEPTLERPRASQRPGALPEPPHDLSPPAVEMDANLGEAPTLEHRPLDVAIPRVTDPTEVTREMALVGDEIAPVPQPSEVLEGTGEPRAYPPEAPTEDRPALTEDRPVLTEDRPVLTEGFPLQDDDEPTIERSVSDLLALAPKPSRPAGPRRTTRRHVVDLSTHGAFLDMPAEARQALEEQATVRRLKSSEEVSGFGLALVVAGRVDVAAIILDSPAAHLEAGGVLRSRGTVEEAVGIRVVCSSREATVATWDEEQVAELLKDVPWVDDELREAANRVHALVGATLGPIGEELDVGLRDELTRHLQPRRLIANEQLASEGGDLPGLVVVGAGELLTTLQGEQQESVGPGEFLFPAEVVSAGTPAPADVHAGPDGALILFADRSATYELLATFPPLLDMLTRM